MKRIFLLTLCLIAFTTTWALPVTKEQARSQARQFIHQRLSLSDELLVMSDVSKSIRKSPSSNPEPQAYYVFNVNSDDGFIIVSGDDSTMPILGWCDHGSFDEATMPENMRALLEAYAEELLSVQSLALSDVSISGNVSQQSTFNTQQPVAVKEAIAPMLTTRWNQGSPFNQLCPYYLNDTNNKHCMTGCVATSMAQVLAYKNNRPAGTTMDIPAYDCTTKWTKDSIQIHVDKLPKTTFDWDNMLDVYNNNATDEQKLAVAKLMLYCGAAIHADYGESSTSAYQSQIVPMLRTFFNTDATRIMRSDYTYAQWNNIIYDELLAGRPVIYDGKTSGGGHSFVVDGFDGGELFHVNWGWGGHNDGYFALSILHPADNSGIGASTTSDGYSYNQSAIIGIQPGVAPMHDPAQMTPSNIEVSGNKVTFSIYNRTGDTHTFDIGLGAIDNEGNISNVIKVKENAKLDHLYGWHELSVTINRLDLAPGVYHYVVTSKESSSDTWLTMMKYWKEYIEVTVDDNQYVTLRLLPLAPQLSLAGSLTVPSGNKYVDDDISVTAIVKNSGGEFYGPLYLFASQTNDKGKYYSRLGMTIAAGASAEATFTFKPNNDGLWNLWLCTDTEGKSVLGTNTMVANKSTYAKPGYLEVTSIEIVSPIDEDSWTTDGNGIRQVDVLSKSLSLYVRVRNTSSTDLPGSNKVQVKLEKYNGGQWKSVNGYNYTIKNFKANTGYRLTTNGGEPIDFSEIGYGLYRIAIYLTNEEMDIAGAVQDVRYQLNLTGGYPVWVADGTRSLVKTTAQSLNVGGNVVAIDLSNFEFSSITPNDNPNTLYFLSSTQTVPTALQGKNVIQDDAATSITLTDGYSFFTPVDFTAQHISYSRTFTTPFTTEGTGWNSFVLPFKPRTIIADGRQIDWFRTLEEEDKDFFIMEFSGDDETTAYFDCAAHFLPYRPYIIGVPGEEFGNASLINKEIVFSATDAAVPATQQGVRSGNSFKFYATTAKTASGPSIFSINTTGNAFVPTTNGMKAFRAYFVAQDNQPARINIDYARFKPAGIIAVKADAPTPRQGTYTLSGVRVDTPPTSPLGSAASLVEELSTLKKGIYIINGRKTVVK